MDLTFEERLSAIAWGDYGTAYGSAVKVPDELRRLAGGNHKEALAATHDLWCGLCHQHVQVGSAALPALPFLLEVLDRAHRELTVELLDILLGFAVGVNQQRAENFQRSLGRDAQSEEQWVADLRAALLAEALRLRQLADSPDEEVADFAGRALAELGLASRAEPGNPAEP